MSRHIFPTVAEAIEAHRLLIEEFGGSHGLRDRGLLEAAILRPQSGYYANLIEEAAALMESLAANHAFMDGNKRISFVMTDALLRANGYFLEVEPLSAYRFIVQSLEKGEFKFVAIRDWLASYVREL
jgi:death-on-curing protein